MNKKLALVMLMIAILAGTQTLGFAADASPWTTETTYMAKTGNKLSFGLKNALLGWTELFTVPAKSHEDGKNLIEGFGTGILNTVIYTVGGVLHAGTFFIPVDVPLPNGGVQIG